MSKSETLTIKEAAALLGIKVHTLRTLKRKGTIPAEVEMIGPNGNIPRLAFRRDDIENYAANRGSFGHRDDGRNKFVIYLSPDEALVATNLLKEAGYSGDALPHRANPPKGK